MGRQTRRVGFVVMMAVLGLTVGPAAAQDPPGADWLRVNIVSVVPERFDDYIELQMEEVNPALREAGVPWRSVWRTAEFGNSYEFQFVTPVVDLSDFDSGGPLARVLRPDRMERLVERLRRATVSRRSYAVRYHADLSVESDEVAGLFLARLATIHVAPGRAADWRAFLERNLPSFRGANAVFGVYERLFGPGPVAWQIVQNYESFTQLTEPSLIARAFGDDAAEVASELTGVVVSIEREVLRYDAELSFSSPASP